MADEVTTHGVVPDVIETAWTDKLEVRYPTSKVTVDYGKELTPTDVRYQPELTWKTDEDALYLICMTDPDAPSRENPKAREWLHWLAGNISGTSINEGTTLAEYIGSAPPKDTGLHRYVFLVYKQPAKINFDEQHMPDTSTVGRANFSISKFAKKYKLGVPVAGNFYQAQHDKTSDIIHQSFKH